MEKKKILKGGVIGTLMSNYGLQNYFKNQKYKIYKSQMLETDMLKKKCKKIILI